jgi:exopolyphosphatase/pppGpp-phosphohydrolase
VRNVLSDFRRTAESLGAERTLAIATSAVRDAENGEAFRLRLRGVSLRGLLKSLQLVANS